AAGDLGVLATPPADDPLLLATAFEPVTVFGADEVVDLELEVSNVRGVVSRSDGSPAAGARVTATSRGHHEAWTYPDGSYRLALPSGVEHWLRVSPPAQNPALDVPRVRRIDVAESGVTTADLALSQPNLRGRVLAPDGATGVAGASVQVLSPTGHVPGSLQMVSRSDGSYGFHVPEGTWRIAVTPPVEANPDGWVDTVADGVQVTAEHTPDAPAVVDVSLEGPTLTGVVRTPDGDPVPRARITAYSESAPPVDARSDAAGRYGIDVPAGVVQIDLRAAVPQTAYLDRGFRLTVPELPHEADLVFGRPNVVGRVVTADGLPVRGARLRAYGPDELPDSVRSATADRQGRFALRLDPGTTQRVVADPPAGFPDGVRTGRAVEVPGGDGVAEVEVVVDRPTPAAYDVVPLDLALGGRQATRSFFPAISGDGTVVAVNASVEDPCDCNPEENFYGNVLHDNVTGQSQPLLAPNGQVISTFDLELDGDGSRVAFLTTQDGLVEGDDDHDLDAFVLDRPSNTLHRLAPPQRRPWSGIYPPHLSSDDLALSADGSRLVLTQQGGDEEGIVFFDITVVELGENGAETSRQVVDVKARSRTLLDLSADGSTLAWSEFEHGAWGLHVLDLASGVEDDVTPFSDGVDVFEGTVDSPSLSTDGRVVAYNDVTFTEDPDSSYVRAGVRLADRSTGTDRAVGLFAGSGGPVGDGVERLELAGDGQSLLVLSPGGQPEEAQDQVWVVDPADDSASLVSRSPGGRPASEGVSQVAVPSDFSVLAFTTRSEELTGTREEFVALALGEVVPPEWPDGATLGPAPGGIGSTTLRLQWSEATDNAAVTGYRVFRGTQLVGVT
ncbi:MAG TPA: carboxypeptidase-like regulatory domain-containing protein, partial [Nocardioides sp.]|nr:carboxypeptidase-like regulatory domain-containing protein [Nocardioides sp.]